MDIISGNVTTTQEISGEVSPIKSVFGEATLLQATWTSISGKPFNNLDDSDFEVVDGVLKVIGGGGGGGTSTLCWLPSVSADGVLSFAQSASITPPTAVNIKGPKGDTGLTGTKGDKGDKGDTGEQGIQGLQGIQGEKGDTGEKGTDGINGTNGTDGQDGFSPTITVYENTDMSYKLSVTDVNGSFQTPNLKGSNGGGTGGTTDYTALSNKPTINTVELIGNKTSADLGIASAEHSHTVSNISDFPTSLPASDVSEWAKSPTKPTYTASEVGALPNTTTIPTKTSQLTNDSNFVVDSTYVHTDNNFTSALKSSYDNAVTNSHTHSNKSVLDNTTASYTTEEKTKLSSLDNYSLPTASTTVKGGIKVDGTSITVDENGVASASESGGGLTEADVFAICEAGVTTLGNQITTISWYMSRAYIPSSVISMGSNWFREAIATYEINGGEHLTTAGTYFAYNCTALTTLSLPALTTARSHFAQSCTSLTTISLPALTTADTSFAQSCTALTTISLPVLTTAGTYFACNCPLTHLVVGGANTLTLTSTSNNTYTAWKLPVADMVAFGTALTRATATTTLTFGATYWNALTAAQKAIFTNKNYTVTTA